MTKSVFRTVNTVGPKELLPVYFLLDNELNRILRDEKEKLEQLIVKDDGKAVEKVNSPNNSIVYLGIPF